MAINKDFRQVMEHLAKCGKRCDPEYVLESLYEISGAEEDPFNIQYMQRAVLLAWQFRHSVKYRLMPDGEAILENKRGRHR